MTKVIMIFKSRQERRLCLTFSKMLPTKLTLFSLLPESVFVSLLLLLLMPCLVVVYRDESDSSSEQY